MLKCHAIGRGGSGGTPNDHFHSQATTGVGEGTVGSDMTLCQNGYVFIRYHYDRECRIIPLIRDY